MKREDPNRGEAAYAWGQSSSRPTTALIALCFAGLIARMVWPEPLSTGWTGYLFAMLYLAAALEAIMETASGFTWQSGARYLRASLLASAVLLFVVL